MARGTFFVFGLLPVGAGLTRTPADRPPVRARIPGVDTGYSPCIITVQWDFFDSASASSRQRSTLFSREGKERSSSFPPVAAPEGTKILNETPDRCSQAHSPVIPDKTTELEGFPGESGNDT